MTSPLDKAKQRLAELQREMDEVRHFIEMYYRFETGEPRGTRSPNALVPRGDAGQLVGNKTVVLPNQPVDNGRGSARKGRPAGPGPREIVEIMERVIREADRPLSRGEIVDAFERREIEIPAQDKARYVGTIAWRNKAKFINIDGRGYWLRGEILRAPSSSPGASHFDPPEEDPDDGQTSIFD